MNARAALALPGLVLLCAACDVFAPDRQPLELSLSLTASTPQVRSDSDEGATIDCNIQFVARASGSGDGVARWDGGELRWFIGGDRADPVHVEALSPGDVTDFWDREEVRSGETATTTWTFFAGLPFVLEAEFRYLPTAGGPATAVTGSAGCGVDLSREEAAPPTVEGLSVNARAPFQPGDRFTVSWTAFSEAGLWETRIVLRGAYGAVHVFSEGLAGAKTRREELVVPPGVHLGSPLHISIEVIDAFGQRVLSSTAQTPPVVDETPPQLSVTTMWPPPETPSAWLEGQYAVGDTMRLTFVASDNHGLADLTYAVADRTTIVPLHEPQVFEQLQIEMKQAWLGTPDLRVQLSDLAGLKSPEFAADAGRIRVFPRLSVQTATWRTSGRIGTGVWDDVNERFYLAGEGAETVFEISSSTMAETRRFVLPGTVSSLDLAPDSDRLVVALSDRGSVAVVDLRTAEVWEIPLGRTLVNPRTLRILDNDRVFIGGGSSGEPMVLAELDLRSGSLRIRTDAREGHAYGELRLARSHDRSVLGLLGGNCLIVFHAVTDRFGDCIELAAYDSRESFSAHPAGDRFAVGDHVVEVASRAVSRAGWGMWYMNPNTTALSADGSDLFIGESRGITRIRIADGVALERLPVVMPGGEIFTSTAGRGMLVMSNDPEDWPGDLRVIRVSY